MVNLETQFRRMQLIQYDFYLITQHKNTEAYVGRNCWYNELSCITQMRACLRDYGPYSLDFFLIQFKTLKDRYVLYSYNVRLKKNQDLD